MTARVRVVVVDHDGGDLTLECLRSLAATEWPAAALDVVLVDNASAAPVTDRVAAELPDVRIVRSPENRGFGAGCNLGIGDLEGIDHVALVNNDVTVSPDWLSPLVEALDDAARIGAACPKILLHHRYRSVSVQAPTVTRRLDPRTRGVRVLGFRAGGEDLWTRVRCARGFWGPEYRRGAPVSQWTGNGPDATLLLPAVAGPAELLLAADRPVPVTLTAGDASTTVVVSASPSWHAVPDGGEAADVIHNVGSTLEPDGYGADRGYLEVDRGQYDEPADVFAWCGAAVLLSGAYLRDVGRFDEDLFLYYEDFELAWRGRTRGWRYRSAPRSVVRHVHSASSSARATRTARLNERNHLVVLARHGSGADTRRALWHFVRATASYARRDLLAPVAAGHTPNPATVGLRVGALAGFATGPVRRAVGRTRTRRRTGRRTGDDPGVGVQS